MAIVTLTDIHIAFGSEVVFDHMALQLHAGEKVGMVGANGAGKSTIFKLILGEHQPDIGQVIIQKGLRIAYLPQESSFDGQKTVLEEMHAGVDHILRLQRKLEEVSHELATLSGGALKARMQYYDQLTHEFELAGGYDYEKQIQITLAGLGFAPELHQVKTSSLSGGQLSRLGLAQVLMLQTDLLLLDEPTNHLDLQATEWLERFILNYAGAAVIISHDRYLLDKVASKIVDVENRQVQVWPGNYSNFVDAKETVRLQQQREQTRRREMVERTLDFIARNKDQEGMRKTARGRKTRLNRLLKENPDFLDQPFTQRTIHFSFAEAERKGDLIFRCEDLSRAFDDLVLFKGLTLDILNGDRLGITGPNGTGKSTFLKLALGDLPPTSGSIRPGARLKIGYLDQHGDVLDPDQIVLDEAMRANRALSPQQVRNRLGAFLFTEDDVFKKCGDLSGGQRNRLMLCRLVLGAPDVLIMDEPTNHLDIASREMLEQALDDFTGTLIVVSHDRYFLDRTVDRLLVIGTDEVGNRCLGRHEQIDGEPAYSLYAELVQRRREAGQQSAQRKSAGTVKPSGKPVKVREKTPEELKRFNKFSVEQLEAKIMTLEDDLVALKERFGDEAIYKDPTQLARLQQEYDQSNTELALLYRAYERRA